MGGSANQCEVLVDVITMDRLRDLLVGHTDVPTDTVLDQWPAPLYMVGGTVRDTLLGIQPKDMDICSSLLPDEVVEYLTVNHHVRCEVTNPSHLVVTLWLDAHPIEHTTFRREGLYDGVHAALVEPSTITEDAFRRDLTINALYMPWGTSDVIDLVGGVADLGNKVLRLISSKEYGDEYQRLWEHGGRLFRLARFASSGWFRINQGWSIHPDTMAACREFVPHAFTRGKHESFGEEWGKAGYCWEYLLILDMMGFLAYHNIRRPVYAWYKDHPWYSLWVSAGKPVLSEFQSKWKLPKDTVLEIQDLVVGKTIQNEWQWRTTKFRRLSAETVAEFWGKSFRVLPIPTQGEVAAEVGAGPQVQQTWVCKVRQIYESTP